MSQTAQIKRLTKATPAPATSLDWLRSLAAKARKANEASIVSRAMAAHAINGALTALDDDNPFTIG